MDQARTFVVGPERRGQRLDLMLASSLQGTSRTQIARRIAEGAVTVNRERAVPSRKVRAGDVVVWAPAPAAPSALAPEPIPLRIVFEDQHLLVVDKPAGMVVHPAPGHAGGTLVNALLAHCRDLRGVGGALRPGIVHRLDKDTSGLLVVAKDDVSMGALGAAFKAHSVRRVYEVLVAGRPPRSSGRIETLHGRDPRHRKQFTTRVRRGRTAVTEWQVVEDLGRAARLEARLETGRAHQVRVHVAAMGCPVLGDKTYGRPPRDPAVREVARTLGRQALHARVLAFRHPVLGEWIEFSSDPPDDFQRALSALRSALAQPTRE